jgi:hypothetical protein
MPTATLAESSATYVLRQSPQPLLRRLDVYESEEEVILAGTLPSYFLKQVAQESIRPVLAGRRLLNRIVVA